MADDDLTILGQPVRGPVEHLETFPAPDHCTRVRFTTDEVTTLCPITGQPDFSTVVIEYQPAQRCVESKSLKLWLFGLRDKAAFAEQLAVDIATEVQRACAPVHVTVTVTQHVRGGIVTEAEAKLP